MESHEPEDMQLPEVQSSADPSADSSVPIDAAELLSRPWLHHYPEEVAASLNP